MVDIDKSIKRNVSYEINKLICEITEEEASDKMRTFKALHVLKGFLSDPNKDKYKSFYPSTSNETRITTYKCWASQWYYVFSGDKKNLVNDNLKFISNKWFDDIWGYQDGLMIVVLDNKYNYMKENGKFLLKYWVDYCGKFEEDGFASIAIEGVGYYVNTKGEIFTEPYDNGKPLNF